MSREKHLATLRAKRAECGTLTAEDLMRERIAELERIISKANDALTTPYANDEERIENARRILERR